jgi:hypothetical protein
MPGYHVDVIDLGLSWLDAMDLGLDTETFTRKKALPEGLVLTPEERRAFEGRRQSRSIYEDKPTWICERVELNAFTAPALIAYIEGRLQDTGVRGKVIPPEAVLQTEARSIYHGTVARWAQRVIERLLPIATITEEIARHLTPDLAGSEARDWIDTAFAEDQTLNWQTPIHTEVATLVDDQADEIEDLVRAALRLAIQDGALADPDDEEDPTDD